MSIPPRRKTDDDPVDHGLSRLYGALPQAAQPDHLDAAILAAARRATGSRPGRPGTRFAVTWRVPFAVAAVIVLSVSLVTLMMEEGDDRPEKPVPVAPPSRTVDQAPQAGVPAAPGRPVPAERALRPVPPAKSMAKAEVAKQRSAEPAVTARDRAAPAVVESREEEAKVQRPEEQVIGRTEQQVAQSVAAIPAPVAAPAMPSSAEAMRNRLSSADSAGAGARTRRQSVMAEGRPAAEPQSVEVTRLIGELTNAPPEKWLEEIGKLRRDDRHAEADAMLAEFRKRFPSHQVPAALIR